MKKILVVGCSMSKGHGLEKESQDPKLWVNQICESIGTVHNLSVTGRNNQWIFHEAMSALLKEKDAYDIVLIGWSAIPRYFFHVGLELYSVHTMLDNRDVNINNGITFSGSWLSKIGNNLRKIQNDHWDILDLVKYVNTLIMIHETSPERRIFFVNTLSPWCKNYFNQKKWCLPTELHPYEQNLLQAETRNDDEIHALYQMIHNQYREYGGIREPHWLNLYDSLRSMQIDDVSESDLHPGYASQDKYADYLGIILKRKLGIV
jgi:hypothetical protein